MLIAVVITSCAVACFSFSVTALVCALQNARSASFFRFRGRRQFPRRECPYAQNKRHDKLKMFHSNFLWYLFERLWWHIRPGWSSHGSYFGNTHIAAKILMVRPKESRGWQCVPRRIKKVRLHILIW